MNRSDSRYQDARTHALAVAVTQGLFMTAIVANLILVFGIFAGFSELEAYGPLSDGSVLVTFIIAAVTFSVWTWRVVENARTFKPSMNATPGWAIGWYFVPVASLWKPYSYLEETWDASTGAMSRNSSMLLRWWWAIWLGSNILGTLGNQFVKVEAEGQVGMGLTMILVSLFLRLGLCLLVIRIALRLAEMQREKRSNGGAAEVFA